MPLTKVSYSMIEGAYVNVLDFGAVGDGAADDTAAIQAAIDYAYDQGIGPSHTNQPVVYLPSGQYKVTDSLVLKDYANLRGAGRRSTTILSTVVNKSVIRPQYGESPTPAERTRDWDISGFTLLNSLVGNVIAPTGLAAGGTLTSITLDSSASSVNGYYVGWGVQIEGGPGAPSGLNTITAYNGTTKVATVGVAFSTAPTTSSRYRLETNAIGINMGSTGYSSVSDVEIVNYTKCVSTTNNGYYNVWQNIKAVGYICFALESDGGGNSLIDCESQFYYQGVRVDRGDFIQTGGTVEALLIDTTNGTAQAGGASTITLAAGESSTNQRWTGYLITIESGTGAPQQRTISNYDGSTKVATVSTAWVTPPDNTSVYHIGSAQPHVCNYVGYGSVGTNASLKSVNVYYETATRSSFWGNYGPTMVQCTIIGPSKRGYIGVLTVSVPDQIILLTPFSDYTPFTNTLRIEFANGIQGTPQANLRAPSGNQINVYGQNNVTLGYIGADSFCPLGDITRRWGSGAGSPEGVLTATTGALYTNTVGGANTTLYVKESGSGNTGWVAK